MNFQTILEELDKLYEAEKLEQETAAEESNVEEPVELADEEIEIEDDESSEDEEEKLPLVLECSNCGALVIKPVEEVKIDKATDLANVDEACTFCEEVEGYKIIGALAAYEDDMLEESLEEGFVPPEDCTKSPDAGSIAYYIIKASAGKRPKVGDDLSDFDDQLVDYNYMIKSEAVADAEMYSKSYKNHFSHWRIEDYLRTRFTVVYSDTAEITYIVKEFKPVLNQPGVKEAIEAYGLTKEEVNELLSEGLEEGIFDFGKKKKSKNSSSDDVEREVEFKVYDENGTLQFNQTFTELPGKMNAEDQFKKVFKERGVYNTYRKSTGKRDWSYERTSNPPVNGLDTKRGRTQFLSMDLNLESLEQPVEDEELEEFLDASPTVNLSLDGGTGNDVSVLGLGESLKEQFVVKYGYDNYGVSDEFDTLDDAVKHINDGMKKRTYDTFVLYNGKKEMIWLDYYRDRQMNSLGYTISRHDDKSVSFDKETGLTINLGEGYWSDREESPSGASTPYAGSNYQPMSTSNYKGKSEPSYMRGNQLTWGGNDAWDNERDNRPIRP